MQNDAILSLRRYAWNIVRTYQMDYEGYTLHVSHNSDDESGAIVINIILSNERGEPVAKSVGCYFNNMAVLQFTNAVSLAAARMNSVTGLTL